MAEANKHLVAFIIALIIGVGGGYVLGVSQSPAPQIIMTETKSTKSNLETINDVSSTTRCSHLPQTSVLPDNLFSLIKL